MSRACLLKIVCCRTLSCGVFLGLGLSVFRSCSKEAVGSLQEDKRVFPELSLSILRSSTKEPAELLQEDRQGVWADGWFVVWPLAVFWCVS